MSEEVRCQLRGAVVQPERQEALQALIDYCYARRTLAHADAWDRIRHGEEIVRTLRRLSAVYRTLSTETRGPLLFELGFFRITDGRLEPVASTLPDPHPKAVALVLSEFLSPGAEVRFGTGEAAQGWRLRAEGAVRPLAGEQASRPG